MNADESDREDAEHIARLLNRQVGYGVELFDTLYVRNLENGQFAVGTEDGDDEVIFTDAIQAASSFVARRRELRLGYDFERGA